MKPFILLLAIAGIASAHPLDPLTKEELDAAVAILRAEHRLTDATRVPYLSLQEPSKQEILAGRTPPRRAFAVLYERASRQTFEAVVDLSTRRVASWREIKGVQPPLMLEDFAIAEQVVRADAGWRAAVRKRGITDLTRVQVDGWAPVTAASRARNFIARCVPLPTTAAMRRARTSIPSKAWWRMWISTRAR